MGLTLAELGGFLPYGMALVCIVFPKGVRALFERMNPTRSYSGWSSSDWFIRLMGIIVLIFFLILELPTRH